MNEHSRDLLIQGQLPGFPEGESGGEFPEEVIDLYWYGKPYLSQIQGIFNEKPTGGWEDREV